MNWPFPNLLNRWLRRGNHFEGILELFDDHVHVGELTADGRYVPRFSGPTLERFVGASRGDEHESGKLWGSCVDPLDRASYERFWAELLAGRAAEVTYRPDGAMENWTAAIHPDDVDAVAAFDAALVRGRDADVEYRLRGFDGVTRWVHDRATARLRADGTVEVSGIVSDVTERRRLHTELESAHSALARVVEAMDDHLYTLGPDADGRYRSLYRGPNLERLTGRTLALGAVDDLWAPMVHPHDRGGRQAAMANLDRGVPIELEYRVTGRDGNERIVLDRLRPRRAAGGTLLYDGVTRDITERRKLENELRRAHHAAEQLATTDELTGAYNRRHFTAIAAQALADDAPTSGLLLLDADHFKRINDVHGHVAGDAVLVELVRRLRTALGPDDVLARWGGEEFAVLVRQITSDDDLARRAEVLLDAVAATPVAVRDLRLALTVSIGGVRACETLTTLDALIEHADRHLYAAKREGRNRVSLPHEAQPPFTTRISPAG